MKSLLLLFTVLSLLACEKKSNCYDAQLEKDMKDKFCTMDCPGVIGCDGKEYCNTCLMNKAGITEQKK